ncbi:MAG: pyrimidine dimer DNA glycosylase/endonuclease V [Candidatus Gracilibacteria bacterium]|nr:pyrimidine dimer DNA glycosylase/endonuclease V [Candidatus Gracilibacteria bacterium]
MTRVNLVNPKDLYDQHLLSEHREIKRIPNVIKSGKYVYKDIPSKYILGKGHVKFFYDKLKFLHNRYVSLYKECLNRSFKVENYEESFFNLPAELYNDYEPKSEDIELNKKRLTEKYKPNFYRYYGEIK